jgi:hypothetical protein
MESDKKETKKKSSYSIPNISDKYPPSKEAYEEIFRIMNRRRPYCPNDFKPQSFFPDLD